VRRKTFAPGDPPFGKGFAKKALLRAINFSLTAASRVSTSRHSADLSEQLAGA
jgi:hypothetical protein